ncbi:MAG: hypothetical protein HRT51_13515 [Colwellia sp.]|nr:hypothetical protein [Colwellia sp.]
MMKQLPPPILVKTWLYVIASNEEGIDYQKFKLRQAIKEIFSSTELAQLYIEQLADDDIEIYFV